MTPQIEQHYCGNGNLKKRVIIMNNFLGGIAWGVGTVIGATIIAAAIIYFLKSTGVFNFVQQIIPPTT